MKQLYILFLLFYSSLSFGDTSDSVRFMSQGEIAEAYEIAFQNGIVEEYINAIIESGFTIISDKKIGGINMKDGSWWLSIPFDSGDSTKSYNVIFYKNTNSEKAVYIEGVIPKEGNALENVFAYDIIQDVEITTEGYWGCLGECCFGGGVICGACSSCNWLNCSAILCGLCAIGCIFSLF